MKELKVRLTFTEEVLGTASNNPQIHDGYIASKAPDALSREEEVASLGVEEVSERTMTIFPRLEDGTPFIWNYQIKGFFKDTGRALNRVKDTKVFKTPGLKAFIKCIEG